MASTSLPSRNKNFKPTDQELVMFLYNKVNGNQKPNDATILECDLYGEMNPWEIWEAFGGSNSYDGKDLYFFTTLKKKSSNGSRLSRTIGRGSWEGEDVGKSIVHDETKKCIGLKKRFRFEKSDTIHDGGWIMHEFSLQDTLLSDPSNKNYVLCRFRKNQRYEVVQQNANAEQTNKEGTSNNQQRKRKIEGASSNQQWRRRTNEGTSSSNQQWRRKPLVLALPAITQNGNYNVPLREDTHQGQKEPPQSENNRTEFECFEEDGDSTMSWPELFAEQLKAFEQDLTEEEDLIPNSIHKDLLVERVDEKYLIGSSIK